MNSPIYNKEYILTYNMECALTAPFWYENKKGPQRNAASLIISELLPSRVLLQLSEVLDGANHLRSV